MLHTATYAAIPCHLTPPRPATPPYPPPQHEDPIISNMTIVTMNPVEREHKFKIHACRYIYIYIYIYNDILTNVTVIILFSVQGGQLAAGA